MLSGIILFVLTYALLSRTVSCCTRSRDMTNNRTDNPTEHAFEKEVNRQTLYTRLCGVPKRPQIRTNQQKENASQGCNREHFGDLKWTKDQKMRCILHVLAVWVLSRFKYMQRGCRFTWFVYNVYSPNLDYPPFPSI